MIALSFALPQESSGLVRQLAGTRRSGSAALPIISGTLAGHDVVVVHSGVGMDSATERLGSFLQTHAPSMWVACGFGGGLSAELEVGDIVVARNLSDSAPFDAIGPLRARTGTLITTTEVIETALQKKQLASHTGATVVDMETVAIRRLCDARGIPMLAVRAISDAAGQNLPIPSAVWFDAHAQRPRPIPLVLHLAGHPGRILPFARFVRGIGRAHGSLTRFLVAAVPVLAERWK